MGGWVEIDWFTVFKCFLIEGRGGEIDWFTGHGEMWAGGVEIESTITFGGVIIATTYFSP